MDNPALGAALNDPLKLLLVYAYEPTIWDDAHYAERHQNFIKESLADLNKGFLKYNTEILCVESEIISFFKNLLQKYDIATVYSTEETGLEITYTRDLNFATFCDTNTITWKEFQNNGVIRGIKNRATWRENWYSYMTAEMARPKLERSNLACIEEIEHLKAHFKCFPTQTDVHQYQIGGIFQAYKWLNSFFEDRIAHYSDYISKPELARTGCSRLSPYFAWGNLSIREVYQRALVLKKNTNFKKQYNAFISRLRWQSHFIQKFEMEHRMEFEAINKGFLNLEQPLNDEFVTRWKAGSTGYPLVDASIRCVVETGYINFRMRSMIVSFLTHHLFQHFTTISAWLARQFLDFEPGIHYGQIQMQSGFTGTNTVRVYNPVKNAHDHDNEAVFIKKYVPELRRLPVHLAIEPWTISEMEETFYGFSYGIDYPERIVDIAETRRIALQKLYGHRKSDLARAEKERILERHTIPRKSKK